MEPVESLRTAWRSIRGHRLRSALTTLGVAAVITFVTLGASLQGAVVGEVAADRSPAMSVFAQPEGAEGGPEVESDQAVFTEHDVQQVRALERVETVVPQGSVSLSGVSYGGRSIGLSSMTATTPAYFDRVGQDEFSEGEPFDSGEREVVLNEQAATLFEADVSVGDTIRVTRSGETVDATVVGILESESSEEEFGPPGGSQPQVYGPTDPFYENRIESPTTGGD